MTKHLNIGMVGYGFMARAHSNAWANVAHFFETGYRPVLKAAAARNDSKLRRFADMWGYESVESDWRALVARKDIDAIDICVPNDLHAEIAIAAAEAAVGLALVIAIYRHRQSVRLQQANQLKG